MSFGRQVANDGVLGGRLTCIAKWPSFLRSDPERQRRWSFDLRR